MTQHLVFSERKCKNLSINISPKADFKEILKTVHDISLPQMRIKEEEIIYSVLELINNSIRAHREKDIHDFIELEVSIEDEHIFFKIKDKGGGFDPSILPYDINDDIGLINIHSENFQTYREKNGYLKFGMGLYLAKKTFSHFELLFVGRSGKNTFEYTPQTIGTCIKLGTQLR